MWANTGFDDVGSFPDFCGGAISTIVVARIIPDAPIIAQVQENRTDTTVTFHSRGAVNVHVEAWFVRITRAPTSKSTNDKPLNMSSIMNEALGLEKC